MFPRLPAQKVTANPYLLSTILRNEWQFGGTVISDYQAVQELEAFGHATSGAEAAQLAITAGVTIEMGVQVPSQYSNYTLYLADLVKSGMVSMATINDDVRHVLTLKYLAGLFAHPLTDPNRVKTAELTPANLAAARTMAGESMVLLNNASHALPLSTSAPSIAVPAGSVSTSGTLTVSADIRNSGSVAGDDVVQLYTHQDGTSILQPVRRLNGFQRVTLAPGQTKTVTFTLGPSNIGFYTNTPGQFVVEPGTVDVYVGDSSVGGLQGQFTVTG